MRKVKQSAENVRLIQSGKGLIETFQSNTKNDHSRQSLMSNEITKECLPVFKNDDYVKNIKKLLNSKDLERSFDLNTHKQYNNLYNAYIAYKQGFDATDAGQLLSKSKRSGSNLGSESPGSNFFMTGINHNEAEDFAMTMQSRKKGEVLSKPKDSRLNVSQMLMNPVNRDTVGRAESPFGQAMSNTMRSTKKVANEEEPEETYQDLNSKLKFPSNPAYFNQKNVSRADKLKFQKQNQTFLDFCREQNIPFNTADEMVYKLQTSKEHFQIFRVYFDAFVDNAKTVDASKQYLTVNPTLQGPHNISIQPNPQIKTHRDYLGMPPLDGERHVGWPSRLSSAQEQVQKFMVDVEAIGQQEPERKERKKKQTLPAIPKLSTMTRKTSNYARSNDPSPTGSNDEDASTRNQPLKDRVKNAFKRKDKALDFLEQQQKERDLKVAQILEKNRQMENTRHQNMQRICKMLEDPVTRQHECRKIDELINPKKHLPTDIVAGMVVDKVDPAVTMLDSCMTGRRQQKQLEEEQKKLVDRVDLDRPILQQEKIKLIMMEQTVIPDTEAYRFMNSTGKWDKTVCSRACNASPFVSQETRGRLTNTEIK